MLPSALYVCDFVGEVDCVMLTADVLACRYRWGVSTSWLMALVTQLGTPHEGERRDGGPLSLELKKKQAQLSRFLRLDKLDPYQALGAVLRRSRLSMERAFQASFAAHLRCGELLQEHIWGSARRADSFGFPIFGGERAARESSVDARRLDELWLDAIAEDFQSDQQAAPVILTADDALQTFAKGVLGKAPSLEPGYGPTYGPEYGPPVHLTTLLKAATNTLRHVSEWEDELVFPYPDISTLKPGSTKYKAMQSIGVLQRAFGIGKDGPIRDVVSCRVLVAVDGRLGTQPPDYARFEAAMIAAARDIARYAGPQAAARLEGELDRVAITSG